MVKRHVESSHFRTTTFASSSTERTLAAPSTDTANVAPIDTSRASTAELGSTITTAAELVAASATAPSTSDQDEDGSELDNDEPAAPGLFDIDDGHAVDDTDDLENSCFLSAEDIEFIKSL